MKISKNEHKNIHRFLAKHYGKPTHCENADCGGKSTSYDWALLKDHEYNKDPESYAWLCRSCHKKYDMTEETRRKMSKAIMGANNPNYGIKFSNEVRRKMSQSTKGMYSGSKNPRAKMVVCTKTGKEYGCIKDAAKDIGVNYWTLVLWLRGVYENESTLKYK